MQEFTQAAAQALQLVLVADDDLLEIVGLSLRVSLLAVGIGALIGIPLGAALAVWRFRGRRLLIILVNALMGLPPIVVGLGVYLLLSATGPFRELQLLYTPAAMIIAQAVLVTPIIAALSHQVLSKLYDEYATHFTLLGLSTWAKLKTLIWEARFGFTTVLLAGFGRAIAEVGAVIIVGGNINHVTRVMTTSIALETSRGNIALALALGIVLLLIAVSVSGLAALAEQWARRRAYV